MNVQKVNYQKELERLLKELGAADARSVRSLPRDLGSLFMTEDLSPWRRRRSG